MESNLVKKYQADASNAAAMDFLEAPDHMTAAAQLERSKMFFSKGNFKDAIMMIANSEVKLNYPDLA